MLRTISVLSLLVLFISCSDTSSSSDKNHQEKGDDISLQLEGVTFVSNEDPICLMPINPNTAKDTLLTEEGIYGFCCTGCKEDFKKQ